MKRIFFLLLFVMPAVALAQSPQDLFQQGLRLERSQGDLSGAIDMYERVAASFGDDRALGALALYRLGQAYETLGESEAESAYQKIIAEFGDQPETVAMAEEALGRITKESGGLTALGLEPVLTEGGFWGASISDDGRYFVNTNWENMALAYQEVGKPGTTYVSPENPEAEGSYGAFGRMSPDNSKIAYVWWDETEGKRQGTHWLRVYDVASRETRELFNNEARLDVTPGTGYRYFEVLDWTSDGTGILIVTDPDSDARQRIEIIEADSGDSRVHVYLPHGRPACLLEDRYVLYTTSGGDQPQVLWTDMEAGTWEEVLPGAETSAVVACSNSAKLAVVRSDETGQETTWLYQLEGGRVTGAPTRLGEMDAESSSVGLTRDGTLYHYRNSQARRQMEVVPLDPDGWTVTGPGEFLAGGTGQVVGWSPESGEMAWLTSLFTGGLVIRSPDGSVREPDVSAIQRAWPEGWTEYQWSPDGSMLFAERDDMQGQTIRLDAMTGAVIDTLEVQSGSTGLSGDGMLAARKEGSRLCVDEYRGVPATSQEVVCIEDQASVSAKVSADPAGNSLILRTQDEEGRRYFRVDLSSGTTEQIFKDRQGGVWSAPGGEGFFVRQDREYYYTDRNGKNPQLAFPRLQEVKNIFQLAAHPTEPLIMIDTAGKQDPSSRELRKITGLVQRIEQ